MTRHGAAASGDAPAVLPQSFTCTRRARTRGGVTAEPAVQVREQALKLAAIVEPEVEVREQVENIDRAALVEIRIRQAGVAAAVNEWALDVVREVEAEGGALDEGGGVGPEGAAAADVFGEGG